VETALYGASVRITGQPVGGRAYALRVRARGLDAAALLEDFPQLLAGAGIRLAKGRADVDATLIVAGSRVLASGQLRLDRLVARFAEPGTAPFTASALIIAVAGTSPRAPDGSRASSCNDPRSHSTAGCRAHSAGSSAGCQILTSRFVDCGSSTAPCVLPEERSRSRCEGSRSACSRPLRLGRAPASW
jgi:hypothetical protein